MTDHHTIVLPADRYAPPRIGDRRWLSPVAVTAAGILGTFAGLQVALAAGAPLGEHFWGGNATATLPAGMRVASGGASLVLLWMVFVVLARAGLTRVRPVPEGRLPIVTWIIAGFFAFNTVGNLASQSAIERTVFGPATALLVVLISLVARRGPRS